MPYLHDFQDHGINLSARVNSYIRNTRTRVSFNQPNGITLPMSGQILAIMRNVLTKGYDKDKFNEIQIIGRYMTQDTNEIESIKDDPGDPYSWSRALRDIFTQKVKPSDFEQNQLYPTITIVLIKRGYTAIKYIGTESTSRDRPFKEVLALSVALQENINHKSRMFRLNDYEYVYCTNEVTRRTIHGLTALIPSLFPKCWEDQETLQAIKDLCVMLTTDLDTPETFLSAAENILFDPREELRRLKETLSSIELKNHAIQIKNLETIIAENKRYIDSHNKSISQYWEQHARATRDLMQATLFKPEENTELFDFLMMQKDISNIAYSEQNNVLEFGMSNAIEYFDEGSLFTMLRKSSSYLYTCVSSGSLAPFAFLACLLTERFDLIVRSYIILNFVKKTADMVTDGNQILSRLVGTNHPHLVHYNCLGNNKPMILAALGKSNYIGAIAQTLAAAKNVNLPDAGPIKKMLDRMTDENSRDTKYIRDNATNEMISVEELIKRCPQVKGTISIKELTEFFETDTENKIKLFRSFIEKGATKNETTEDGSTVIPGTAANFVREAGE